MKWCTTKLHYKILTKNLPKIEYFKYSIALNIKYSSDTSIKAVYKKYGKHFQDPTRGLLDPMVEFVR